MLFEFSMAAQLAGAILFYYGVLEKCAKMLLKCVFQVSLL